MKPYQKALVTTGTVLFIHATLLITDSYSIPYIDVPMHIMGGFAMAMFGLAIHQAVSTKYHTKHSPAWYHYAFVVGFAMLVGIAWEFHEYILDNTVNIWYNLPKSQPSLTDTMKDFLDDWIGASIAFFLFKKGL